MSEKIDWESLTPEQQEILRAALHREGMSGAEITPTEEQMMLGQIYYFIKDDVIEEVMVKDERLKPLMAAVSHLVRTSRLDDERKVREMKLRWKRALRLQLLILNKEENMSDLALFDAMVNYGYSAIEDQHEGWRGKLAAERVKTYKIEGAEKKKKGVLSWLGLG